MEDKDEPTLSQSPVNAQFLSDREYDGDTFWIHASVWPGMLVEQKVRLRGANTPEKNDSCVVETYNAARARTAELIDAGVLLQNMEDGLYPNRVIADVILPDGKNLAEVLIQEGLARPYVGSDSEAWC